jgi:hypothetical protein
VASYRAEFGRLWCALHPTVVLAFVALENLEHLGAGGELLGFGALTGPHYPLALPVLAAVTIVLAGAGAVVRWRIAVLQARLASAPKREPRATIRVDRPVAIWFVLAAMCSRVCIQARQDSSRPPPVLASP